MRKKNGTPRKVARELSPEDAEKLLVKISKAIKAKRKARTTLESFAYEINVSRSAMSRYEDGGDMYLSTFLKLLHGLDVEPAEFFKEVK
jgi:transcriptional regulator with XRE-family HTH domain